MLHKRRQQVTRTLETDNGPLEISIGTFDDGRPAEVFCRYPKTGAALDAITDDLSILLSLLLQLGITAAAIRRTTGNDSIVGRVLDVVVAYDQEIVDSRGA